MTDPKNSQDLRKLLIEARAWIVANEKHESVCPTRVMGTWGRCRCGFVSIIGRIDGALAEKVNTEPAVQVKWVKCADTLPLPHKDYWLCIEGGKFATIGRLNHQFNGDLYWCLENGNKSNDLPYAEVTHYAEIVRPELPSIIRAAKEGK